MSSVAFAKDIYLASESTLALTWEPQCEQCCCAEVGWGKVEVITVDWPATGTKNIKMVNPINLNWKSL